jgi:hypothetical protein
MRRCYAQLRCHRRRPAAHIDVGRRLVAANHIAADGDITLASNLIPPLILVTVVGVPASAGGVGSGGILSDMWLIVTSVPVTFARSLAMRLPSTARSHNCA